MEEMSYKRDGQTGMTGRARSNALMCFCAALFLAVATGCSSVRLQTTRDTYYDPDQGTAAEDIAKYFNLHRGRSFDYYARGCVYLENGHYSEALSDFAVAIAKNSTDTRNAHTYCMDFVEYYPHRESGIGYYLLANRTESLAEKSAFFEKAIEERRISIEQEPSSRAEDYLKRAKVAVDTVRPLVSIDRVPSDGATGPEGRIRVKVSAEDDQGLD